MTDNTVRLTNGQRWTSWLMSCNWRIGILAFSLLSSTVAHAGDYAVAYGLDFGDLQDSGIAEGCNFGESCTIESESLDLSINLIVLRSDRDQRKDLSVSVYGGRNRVGCCYFVDGDRTRSFYLEQGVAHLTLYKGHARRRNEFIRNSRVGILYLQFSDMK